MLLRELRQYRSHKGQEIFCEEPTSLGFAAILTPPSQEAARPQVNNSKQPRLSKCQRFLVPSQMPG
jgi:hypothetical protein